MKPLKCMYCGQFIPYEAFACDHAVTNMTRPDSPFGPEEHETYHRECKKKYEAKVIANQNRLTHGT